MNPEFFVMQAILSALGRTFLAAEGIKAQNPVAMTNDRIWKTEIANAPDVVRQHVQEGEQRLRMPESTRWGFNRRCCKLSDPDPIVDYPASANCLYNQLVHRFTW